MMHDLDTPIWRVALAPVQAREVLQALTTHYRPDWRPDVTGAIERLDRVVLYIRSRLTIDSALALLLMDYDERTRLISRILPAGVAWGDGPALIRAIDALASESEARHA